MKQMQATRLAPDSTGPSHIRRILCVDDELDTIDLLELILTHHTPPFAVTKANSSEEALKILHTCSTDTLPDLILLDIKMPGTDGFTLCEDLKQNPKYVKYRDIPIFIISALAFPHDIEKGFACGAHDYILKPWSNADLVQRIVDYFSLRKKVEGNS